MSFLGSHVLVVGAGKSGIAATRLLLKEGKHVTLYDDKPQSQLALLDDTLIAHKYLILACGKNAQLDINGFDAAVISPGVPFSHIVVEALKAHGIPLFNEIEVALSFLPAHKLLGITGTNGKSTTTVMMESVLKAAGIKAIACGNLGTPLCELALKPFPYEYAVLELSSYQLEALQHIKLDGAIIINITPDHLDRYQSFEHYQNAKLRIMQFLKGGSPMVVNHLLSHLIQPRTQGVNDFFNGNQFGMGDFAFLKKTPIVGAHNQENALAVAMLSLRLGIPKDAIIEGLTNFQPLPHRCEIVACKNGITFINDSKGTTVVAVQYALSMYKKPTHLLLGGIDKGENFADLAWKNFPQIQAYYVFGKSSPKIMHELASTKAQSFANLHDAFHAALKQAHEGDIILLSPGCASFDQFDNYQHRGQVFRDLVIEI